MGPLNKDPALEYMLLQAVRLAFRMHQVTHYSSNLRRGKLSRTLRIPYCQQYLIARTSISHVLISSSTVLFACLIIRTFQLVFSAETVFFSHNKSAGTYVIK